MEIYESDLVRIPYEDFSRLRSEGKVSLGIGRPEAELISRLPDLKPTKTTAAAAFKFWNVIAVLAFLYTIYLSFTDSWWWFLIGTLAAGVVVRANLGANQTNLLDAAMVDREFYEKIALMGGWHYRMALEDAEPYFTAEFREGREAAAQHIAAIRGLADR